MAERRADRVGAHRVQFEKNRKKIIAAAVVLALVVLIGSVLAYFTDTDTATNIFTLGDKIEIEIVFFILVSMFCGWQH